MNLICSVHSEGDAIQALGADHASEAVGMIRLPCKTLSLSLIRHWNLCSLHYLWPGGFCLGLAGNTCSISPGCSDNTTGSEACPQQRRMEDPVVCSYTLNIKITYLLSAMLLIIMTPLTCTGEAEDVVWAAHGAAS